MSDYSISIVPKKSNFPSNKEKAKEILDWLIAKDIVKPELSDCTLSDDGFAISDGAKQVVLTPEYLPFDLITNGLEIITKRQIFDTGENFIDDLICPNCKENIAFDDWDLEHWANQESNNLTCTRCEQETEIHSFTFLPKWGFSDLGFTFWNWTDFTREFIDELQQKLGCDISIVHQQI
jgi:hypothetical protein